MLQRLESEDSTQKGPLLNTESQLDTKSDNKSQAPSISSNMLSGGGSGHYDDDDIDHPYAS